MVSRRGADPGKPRRSAELPAPSGRSAWPSVLDTTSPGPRTSFVRHRTDKHPHDRNHGDQTHRTVPRGSCWRSTSPGAARAHGPGLRANRPGGSRQARGRGRRLQPGRFGLHDPRFPRVRQQQACPTGTGGPGPLPPGPEERPLPLGSAGPRAMAHLRRPGRLQGVRRCYRSSLRSECAGGPGRTGQAGSGRRAHR